MGRKTERELSRPRFVFYRSEAPQQAEARSTKIVFVGRNFSVELSLATCRVRVYEWIVKFEYDTITDYGSIFTITYKSRLTQNKLHKKNDAISSIYGKNGMIPWQFFKILT